MTVLDGYERSVSVGHRRTNSSGSILLPTMRTRISTSFWIIVWYNIRTASGAGAGGQQHIVRWVSIAEDMQIQAAITREKK